MQCLQKESGSGKKTDRFEKVRQQFADGKMPNLLCRYLRECGLGSGEEDDGSGDGGKKKVRKRLPNPAGFCRFLGLERNAFRKLESEFPKEIGRMRAVFEDEALNADLPATVLSFYLKYLFGEDESGGGEAGETGGEIRVVFAHDILEDGK